MSDLEYADDMALISNSYKSLSTFVGILDLSCHRLGLTINDKKTKLLAVLPGADSHYSGTILSVPWKLFF